MKKIFKITSSIIFLTICFGNAYANKEPEKTCCTSFKTMTVDPVQKVDNNNKVYYIVKVDYTGLSTQHCSGNAVPIKKNNYEIEDKESTSKFEATILATVKVADMIQKTFLAPECQKFKCNCVDNGCNCPVCK